MTMAELEEELRHLEDMRRRIEALRETAAEYRARTAAARRDIWETLYAPATEAASLVGLPPRQMANCRRLESEIRDAAPLRSGPPAAPGWHPEDAPGLVAPAGNRSGATAIQEKLKGGRA